MLDDGPPRVSGHTTFRSVIPTEQMPEDLRWNAATLWAGPKCHLVHYPLKGWKVFNLVVTYHNDVKDAVTGVPVPIEEVRRGFGHIHPRAQQIIEHGSNWKLWVLCDRDPNERWVDGRVVLLGDAAHPMLQYFAQGACQAMEDAVCLSHMLANHDDHAAALEAYRAQRFPRTARTYFKIDELKAARSGLDCCGYAGLLYEIANLHTLPRPGKAGAQPYVNKRTSTHVFQTLQASIQNRAGRAGRQDQHRDQDRQCDPQGTHRLPP